MPVVHLLGKILPVVAEVSVDHDPTVKWESPDIGLTMEFKNHIVKSQIDVHCTLNRYLPSDFVHVYMRALDLCQASVDLVAFSQGCGLTVLLDTFVNPHGVRSPIAPQELGLACLCTAFKLDSSFDEVHSLVLTDWRLGMALHDLTLSITLPHAGAINCARAIEGLRHLIATSDSDDKKAWEEMRVALNVDRAYLQLITDASKNVRRGNRVHVPGSITGEITRRSWMIMDRYFAYRKGGNIALKAPGFPLLTG
jgi:hypothetical protein